MKVNDARGIDQNDNGQPLAPAGPVEFFASLAVFHRKQMELSVQMGIHKQHARFMDELPSFDASTFGQHLTAEVWRDRLLSYYVGTHSLRTPISN